MTADASDKENAASDTVRRRYNRNARFYDREQAMMERVASRWRRELWRRVPTGDVLEVGVGTGINIPLYPAGSKVTGIDIAENMLERARSRAAKLGVAVDLRQMDIQHLDFPDAHFECAIATFVFCSVPDPITGLQELRRVVKPGGALLLLDHVRSENRFAGKLMDFLNPVVVRVAGANINRRTVANVSAAGFELVNVETHLRGIIKVIEARA